jgi:precorrin-2/cobalt-factor-2 C20-methyltransferase
MTAGTIYGVGLGPGDLDLLSVKSDRLVHNAKHVAFFRKAGRKGQARQIAEPILPKDAIEFIHPK